MSDSITSTAPVNVFTPRACKFIVPLEGGKEMSMRFTETEDGNWVAALPDAAMMQLKTDLVAMFSSGDFRLDSTKPLEIREE